MDCLVMGEIEPRVTGASKSTEGGKARMPKVDSLFVCAATPKAIPPRWPFLPYADSRGRDVLRDIPRHMEVEIWRSWSEREAMGERQSVLGWRAEEPCCGPWPARQFFEGILCGHCGALRLVLRPVGGTWALMAASFFETKIAHFLLLTRSSD